MDFVTTKNILDVWPVAIHYFIVYIHNDIVLLCIAMCTFIIVCNITYNDKIFDLIPVPPIATLPLHCNIFS